MKSPYQSIDYLNSNKIAACQFPQKLLLSCICISEKWRCSFQIEFSFPAAVLNSLCQLIAYNVYRTRPKCRLMPNSVNASPY
jgi:hypothetical protein